jgi:hypothetical protein
MRIFFLFYCIFLFSQTTSQNESPCLKIDIQEQLIRPPLKIDSRELLALASHKKIFMGSYKTATINKSFLQLMAQQWFS